jgi:hypothetical protein
MYWSIRNDDTTISRASGEEKRRKPNKELGPTSAITGSVQRGRISSALVCQRSHVNDRTYHRPEHSPFWRARFGSNPVDRSSPTQVNPSAFSLPSFRSYTSENRAQRGTYLESLCLWRLEIDVERHGAASRWVYERTSVFGLALLLPPRSSFALSG